MWCPYKPWLTTIIPLSSHYPIIIPFFTLIITGWWFQPLWKIWVSWDYLPQYMESHKNHVPNHQADNIGGWWGLKYGHLSVISTELTPFIECIIP